MCAPPNADTQFLREPKTQRIDEVDTPHLARSRFVALLGGALLVAGCAHTAQARKAFRVGLVTDTGGLGDRSFNDAAYAGLQTAQRRLGIETTLVQSRAAIDFQANLTLLASNAYDETIALGYLLELDLAEVAKRFPQQHFSIIDGDVDAPNVASVTFKEEEAAYLAGALASLTSRTGTIAFLGGVDVPQLRTFEVGFRAGAHRIDPKRRVLVKYIGSYDDVAGGKELSDLLYGAGADIIFVAAGKAGLGTIQASKNRHDTYVIGVDSNQDGELPGKILTSVLKRIDLAVVRICAQAQARATRSGRVRLGLKEGGVGLTDFRYSRAIVTPSVIAELARLGDEIVAGTIIVPSTREAFAAPDSPSDHP